jgi:hypothetical protein
MQWNSVFRVFSWRLLMLSQINIIHYYFCSAQIIPSFSLIDLAYIPLSTSIYFKEPSPIGEKPSISVKWIGLPWIFHHPSFLSSLCYAFPAKAYHASRLLLGTREWSGLTPFLSKQCLHHQVKKSSSFEGFYFIIVICIYNWNRILVSTFHYFQTCPYGLVQI